WIQLHAERIQLRLPQACFEAGAFKFELRRKPLLFAQGPERGKHVSDRERCPIEREMLQVGNKVDVQHVGAEAGLRVLFHQQIEGVAQEYGGGGERQRQRNKNQEIAA